MLTPFVAGTLHFVAAFATTLAAACLLDPLARRVGWVDHPRGRKAHASAMPLTGGGAIALGVASILLLDPAISPALRGLGAGAVILLAVGIADDFLDLPWVLRLAVQCVAVFAMIHVGDVRVRYIGVPGDASLLDPQWLSLPLSVIIGVGVINAFNMVDGGDGIAASIALAAFALFGIAGMAAGNLQSVQAIVPLAGAVAGFFALNMRFAWQPHARLFLGDAGSSLIGLAIAWVSVLTTQSRAFPVDSTLAPWLVAPPLIDCIATILRRLRQGRSPFRADRGHLHHLLLDAGFSPAHVASLLGVLTLALGTLALLAFRLGLPPAALIVVFVALIIADVALTSDRDACVAGLHRLRQRAGVSVTGESAAR